MRTLRPRQAWGLGVLVAVVALLAVVAVAADGSPLKAPLDDRGGSLGPRLLGVLNVVGLGVLVLGVVMLVFILTGERNRRPQFGRRRNLLQTLLVTAVFFLLGASLMSLRRSDHKTEDERDNTAPTFTAEQRPTDDGGPPWAIIVLGVTVVAALSWSAWMARRYRPPSGPGGDDSELAEQRAAVGAAFDASIADLEAEPDPRRAVIAAYARLLDGLAACGLERRAAEAPEEHLRRALSRLQVRDEPMGVLVNLFAEARFSDHLLTAAHKAAAIDAFRAARADLAPHLVAP